MLLLCVQRNVLRACANLYFFFISFDFASLCALGVHAGSKRVLSNEKKTWKIFDRLPATFTAYFIFDFHIFRGRRGSAADKPWVWHRLRMRRKRPNIRTLLLPCSRHKYSCHPSDTYHTFSPRNFVFRSLLFDIATRTCRRWRCVRANACLCVRVSVSDCV